MIETAIRTLFDYNLWAHERVWSGILTLDDEQFARASDYSIGSVRHQIIHVLSVDRRWMARVAGQSTPPHLQPDDYPTVESARDAWLKYTPEHRALVAGLTDDDLTREPRYEMPSRGGAKHTICWQVLAHVVNHGTDHRAQILNLLHQMGAPTMEQDLILYLWEAGSS
jgi:uncharacterized damage-inducible protein DinB